MSYSDNENTEYVKAQDANIQNLINGFEAGGEKDMSGVLHTPIRSEQWTPVSDYSSFSANPKMSDLSSEQKADLVAEPFTYGYSQQAAKVADGKAAVSSIWDTVKTYAASTSIGSMISGWFGGGSESSDSKASSTTQAAAEAKVDPTKSIFDQSQYLQNEAAKEIGFFEKADIAASSVYGDSGSSDNGSLPSSSLPDAGTESASATTPASFGFGAKNAPTFVSNSSTDSNGSGGGASVSNGTNNNSGYSNLTMAASSTNASALLMINKAYVNGGLFTGTPPINDSSDKESNSIISTPVNTVLPGRARMYITNNSGVGSWYSNFFLESMTMSYTEKYQIMETFAADFISFFGSRPVTINLSGVLYDTKERNWLMQMEKVYEKYVSGTAALVGNTHVLIYAGKTIIEGYAVALNLQKSGATPLSGNFSMSILRAKTLHTTSLPPGFVDSVAGSLGNTTYNPYIVPLSPIAKVPTPMITSNYTGPKLY